MKKVFLSLVLVAAMSTSFVSCKEKAEEGTDVEAAMETVEEAVEESAEATQEAVEETAEAVEEAVETPAAE